MKTRKRIGRPPVPPEQKAKIFSLTLFPIQQAICLKFAATVQDGIRELIRRASRLR